MANPTGKGGFGDREVNNGRPSFRDYIAKVGAEEIEPGMTRTEATVRNAFRIANDPEHSASVQALKWLADRADGSIQQQIDITTQGERINQPADIDLSKLDPAQLKILEDLVAHAKPDSSES